MATFDSGTTKKYALSTADTATANIYAIQEATTAATIKLVGAGDSVYLEGLSSEYTIKASATKVTLHSDTQTITIDLSKSTGAQTLVLIDGAYSLVKGTKSISVNGTAVSKVVELDSIDTTDSTAANTYFNSGSGSSSTGSTFTLTTDADNRVGTDGDDTFTGLVDAVTAANSSFTLADQIDGGKGTDLVSVTVNTTDDGLGAAVNTALSGAALSNIETLKIRSVNGSGVGGTVSLDTSTADGVTLVVSDRATQALTLTGVADSTDLTINGNGAITNGNFTATYAATATTPVLNIANGVTAGNVGVTAAGATDATINSTGAANTIGTLAAPGAATGTLTINAASDLTTGAVTTAVKVIDINGAAPTTLTATAFNSGVTLGAITDANLTTIDASGLTAGGVTVTLLAGITSLVGGAGNDAITTAALTSTTAGIIDGGAGAGDEILVASGTHVDTAAEAALYKNFEVVQNNGATDLDVSLFSGIKSLIAGSGTAGFTKMTAAQAADVKVIVSNATNTFSLASSSGTSDTLGLTLENALANDVATVVSATGLTVTGFENLNVHAKSGIKTALTNITPTSDIIGFAAASNLKNIVIDGGYDVRVSLANALSATKLDVSGTAGAGITLAANTSDLVVTGSSAADFIALATLGTNGSASIIGGGGNDNVSGTLAQAAAVTIDGGAGTDTLALTDAAMGTIADNSFASITGFNKLTMANNVAGVNLTSGGFFNSTFADGVTITGGTVADTEIAVIDLGTYTKAVTATLVSADVNDAGAIVLKGGSAADTLTVTAAGYTGAAAGLVISGNAGADTISFSDVATGVANSIVITGGTGKDIINHTATGAVSAFAVTTYSVTGINDSTASAYDEITGFVLGAGGATNSDKLDLSGTATLQATAAATASGIANVTYAISAAGLLSFAGTGATDLTLAQKLDIANTATSTDGAYVVFTDGANSFVFHQDTTNGDQVVELVGTAALGAATATTAVAGFVFAV